MEFLLFLITVYPKSELLILVIIKILLVLWTLSIAKRKGLNRYVWGIISILFLTAPILVIAAVLNPKAEYEGRRFQISAGIVGLLITLALFRLFTPLYMQYFRGHPFPGDSSALKILKLSESETDQNTPGTTGLQASDENSGETPYP